MFVPIVLDMFTSFLWIFHKSLVFSIKTNSAIIAPKVYCNTLVSEFQKKNRRETLDQSHINAAFLYQIPKDEDLQYKRIYPIPQEILDTMILRQGSISDAYDHLLADEDDYLSTYFKSLIDQIELDCNEKIEAFITFQGEIKSLAVTARDRNIPIIHWELGCWRYPTYLNTAYWDLDDLYGGKSIERRWKCFCKEQESEEIPILSKRECLALLLEKEYLYLIDEYDRRPIKKVGVALGYAVTPIVSSKTHMDDMELLYRAKEKYGLENILIRKHPGEPYGSQYPNYTCSMEQQHGITPEFILNCETIISLISGSGMEAMLFNRKAITLSPCPSYFASGHDLEGEGLCCDENFISFFAFCYLIPLEYMTDVDYLRWRLTMPTEREIYMKNLEFYFRKKALPLSLINKPTGERLDAMLKEQRYYQPKKISDLEKKVAELEQESNRKIEELEQEATMLRRETTAIRRSKSYRIGRIATWLPRKLRALFLKME